MADPARRQAPRARAWFALLAALAVGACSAPGVERGPDPSGTVRVSYDGATAWLATLSPAEAGEQVQDWARLGLASALGLGADRLLDELYDGTVLRDSALTGLVEQPVGPGRTLFDGTTLHLLVPAADPAPQRTVGELLDGYRADRGSDPPQVQVHTYAVDAPGRVVSVEGAPVEPTAQVRAENGWIERRVDDPAALADFLSRADQLARLEVRGTETWALGWDWPGLASDVTDADVAVLQRGYQQTSGPLPGFSLDPARVSTAADLRAVVPGLAPGLADRILSGDYAGSGFASAAEVRTVVEGTLFRDDPPAPSLPARGLPSDRTQLWALDQQLAGRPAYSTARYDGGVAGTEAGMTMFYTDYVAKSWVTGVGTGVPAGVVPGFVPDTAARTPPSLCPPGKVLDMQSGRLWFGQNDAAFAYGPGGVDIGRQATRLYFRADGGAGTEVEPGYAFGRGLAWWDRNYRAVADYEPQYRRLEQLMRWSGALEWLALGGRSLPAAAPPAAGLTFGPWYAARSDLRERGALSFVRPPSATTEAVHSVPSTAFRDCGITQIFGGVSLADAAARNGGRLPERAPLPDGVSRAAPTDPARTALDAAGNGRITRTDPPISYQLKRGTGTGEVTTTGPPSGAVRIGDARLVTDGGRSAGLRFRSDGRNYTFDESIGGVQLGRVEVAPTADGVQISVLGAVGARFSAFLDRLRATPDPATAPGFRYRYGDATGNVYAFADGWIRSGPAAPKVFTEGLVASGTDAAGKPVRVAAGVPNVLSPQDVAALRVDGEPRSTTSAAKLDAFPEGTPVFTDSPAIVVGTTPATAPVRVREARQPEPAVAGSPAGPPGRPGGPGRPAAPGDPTAAGPPAPGAASGGTGGTLGGGPWRLIGVGTGGGLAQPSPGVVGLVSECPSDQQPDRCDR